MEVGRPFHYQRLQLLQASGLNGIILSLYLTLLPRIFLVATGFYRRTASCTGKMNSLKKDAILFFSFFLKELKMNSGLRQIILKKEQQQQQIEKETHPASSATRLITRNNQEQLQKIKLPTKRIISLKYQQLSPSCSDIQTNFL